MEWVQMTSNFLKHSRNYVVYPMKQLLQSNISKVICHYQEPSPLQLIDVHSNYSKRAKTYDGFVSIHKTALFVLVQSKKNKNQRTRD